MAHMLDLLLIAVFLFALVLLIFVGTTILSEFREKRLPDASETEIAIIDAGGKVAEVWDYLFAILLIGCGLATGISAFFINSHPIFFFVSLPVFVFVLIIVGVLSNTYETFTNTTSISGVVSSFPIIDAIMTDFPIWVFILGVVVLFLLYAKGGKATP